jgi:hypothetical protein
MKFRVSGCYWSNGQFRNRGINMLGSFLPSRDRQTTTVYSGRRGRHSYEIISRSSTNMDDYGVLPGIN